MGISQIPYSINYKYSVIDENNHIHDTDYAVGKVDRYD